MAITEGSVTSEKPIKEAIYFPEPLGSFCEVAVFPPIEKPSIYAFFPLVIVHNIATITGIPQ